MLSGLRFVRHSPAILAQLLRTVVFTGIGSGLWALLPVIAQKQLGLGAAGFGLLMACLGCGAVATGPFVGALRARWRLDTLAAASSLLVACAMLAAGLTRQHLLVYVALAGCGAGWMIMLSTLNAATQTSAASWVRARCTSMHVLCSLGSFAFGSAVWGALAGAFGIGVTLCAAAGAMVASVALAKPLPLRMGLDKEVTMVTAWEEPLAIDEPEPDAGPVSVEVVYRIWPDDAEAFLSTMEKLSAPRRRDGASLWRVYRDLSDPTRYVERFIVPSWADYLRQRERATLADQELEARARAFQVPGEAVVVRHYLAER
jgi:MFS family permease